MTQQALPLVWSLEQATRTINRTPWTLRPVPVTHSNNMALDPRLAERLRRATNEVPSPPMPPGRTEQVRRTPIQGVWRCSGHGEFRGPAPQCPSGCSPRFVEPVHGTNPFAPRDEVGHFVPIKVVRAHPVIHPDEALPDAIVRSRLRRVLSHLPKGAKRPLARLCGYRGRWCLHSLRGVAKRSALLPEPCRRRISRVLVMLERGEYALMETGQLRTAGRPSHQWVRQDPRRPRLDAIPLSL
jgi:hypothetical protein